MGPLHLFKAFKDIQLPSLPPLLQDLVQQAYRAAVKISLDKVLLGELNNEELLDSFSDLSTNWFIGMETSPRWKESILGEVPNLFSLQTTDSPDTGQTFFRSHILSLRNCQVSVGRLQSEIVRGLWSSLSLELLYLTNDDDERYSIQAEERILRNLTVQAADSPLGYSIYNSGPKTFRR